MTQPTTPTQIGGSSVLITGANRGLGAALVDAALERGAAIVYAASRRPFIPPDDRVVPIKLDVRDDGQIRQAVGKVDSLDVLINNAGLFLFEDLSDRAPLDEQLAVNLFGPHAMAQAFLPLLMQSGGAIVNVLSLAGMANMPLTPGYSISKAAALSMTQGLRAIHGRHGVRVHAVLAGPIETEMSRDLPVPKTPAEQVARAILDGVEAGVDEIFPDPMSANLAEGWNDGVGKALEREFAAYL